MFHRSTFYSKWWIYFACFILSCANWNVNCNVGSDDDLLRAGNVPDTAPAAAHPIEVLSPGHREDSPNQPDAHVPSSTRDEALKDPVLLHNQVVDPAAEPPRQGSKLTTPQVPRSLVNPIAPSTSNLTGRQPVDSRAREPTSDVRFESRTTDEDSVTRELLQVFAPTTGSLIEIVEDELVTVDTGGHPTEGHDVEYFSGDGEIQPVTMNSSDTTPGVALNLSDLGTRFSVFKVTVVPLDEDVLLVASGLQASLNRTLDTVDAVAVSSTVFSGNPFTVNMTLQNSTRINATEQQEVPYFNSKDVIVDEAINNRTESLHLASASLAGNFSDDLQQDELITSSFMTPIEMGYDSHKPSTEPESLLTSDLISLPKLGSNQTVTNYSGSALVMDNVTESECCHLNSSQNASDWNITDQDLILDEAHHSNHSWSMTSTDEELPLKTSMADTSFLPNQSHGVMPILATVINGSELNVTSVKNDSSSSLNSLTVQVEINPTKSSADKGSAESEWSRRLDSPFRNESDSVRKSFLNDSTNGDMKTPEVHQSLEDLAKLQETTGDQKAQSVGRTIMFGEQTSAITAIPGTVTPVPGVNSTELRWMTSTTEGPTRIETVTKYSTKVKQKYSVTPTIGKVDYVLPTVKVPLTYLSVTMRCSWTYFCSRHDDLQKLLAQHLSNAVKYRIRDSQVIFFNTNICNHIPTNEVGSNSPYASTISVPLYVTDISGEYSKMLTEKLGLVILKNRLQGLGDNVTLHDVVLAVQVHRKTNPKSPTQNQSKTSERDMGIIAAITISCIAGICLLLLCVLLAVLKRRHGLMKQTQRCRKVTDAYSLDSISIYSSFYKRKPRASKRSYLNQGFEDPQAPTNKVTYAGMVKFCSSEEDVIEEYKKIPMTVAKLEDLPPGAEVKNRYANVIPFPETRVQLNIKGEDPLSEYINANYVRGFKGDQRTYVACQAPMESTLVDFWEMVWENQSKVILMLTALEEDGMEKCFPYFAESATIDNHRLFGDYQVTTKKIDTRETLTISFLQLKNLEKNLMREVIHFWYVAWPAQSLPEDSTSVIDMLLEARPMMRLNSGPNIIHCSPGTGRTGTVIAIDICMQEYETTRSVDVPQCVYRLRRDRGALVQTSEQYLYIYKTLIEYTSRILNHSGRSSLRSTK